MKAPHVPDAVLVVLLKTYSHEYREAVARGAPFVEVSTGNFPAFLQLLQEARDRAWSPPPPPSVKVTANATQAIDSIAKATRYLDRPRDHAKTKPARVRPWLRAMTLQIFLAVGVLSFVSYSLLVYDLGRREGREERVARCPSFDGSDVLVRQEVRGGRLDCLYIDRFKRIPRTVVYGRATF